jgi:hypothetical protein
MAAIASPLRVWQVAAILLLWLTRTGFAQFDSGNATDLYNSTTYYGLNSTSANNTDGDLLYGDGFAPDVYVIDTPWDDDVDDYEDVDNTLVVLDDSSDGANDTSVDPDADNSTYNIDKRYVPEWDEEGIQSRDTHPFYLRVMPLGASITVGYHSTDGNGYRKWIREELRHQGWPVNMVGSQQSGTMRDRVSSIPSSAFPWEMTEQRYVFRTTRATAAGSSVTSTGLSSARQRCSPTWCSSTLERRWHLSFCNGLALRRQDADETLAMIASRILTLQMLTCG